MARFLDEETECEFIDISSTSEGQEEGMTGGATVAANLPVPPHQAPIAVRHVLVVLQEPSDRADLSPRTKRFCLQLQVQLDRQIDDAPIVERLEQFLGLRINPTDLQTCAFGKCTFERLHLVQPQCHLAPRPRTESSHFYVFSGTDQGLMGPDEGLLCPSQWATADVSS